MRFLVEMRLNPGAVNNMADTFRSWRPQPDAGVTFQGARIGTRSDVIFVFSESEDESHVAEACRPWDQHGNYHIYPVVDRKQVQ